MDAGLGVVYQHFMLVPPLTVWENVILGREPRRLGAIDRRRARSQVSAVARRSGLSLDVDARAGDLSVAAQQRVEIVKQLWRGARVLILDEPTALLSPQEAAALVEIVRALAAEGRAVLFVSHKLREVLGAADRIAVIRRGRLGPVSPRSQTDAQQLAEAMTGGRRAARELPTFPRIPAAARSVFRSAWRRTWHSGATRRRRMRSSFSSIALDGARWRTN